MSELGVANGKSVSMQEVSEIFKENLKNPTSS
jgi:hypothetical protein